MAAWRVVINPMDAHPMGADDVRLCLHATTYGLVLAMYALDG